MGKTQAPNSPDLISVVEAVNWQNLVLHTKNVQGIRDCTPAKLGRAQIVIDLFD